MEQACCRFPMPCTRPPSDEPYHINRKGIPNSQVNAAKCILYKVSRRNCSKNKRQTQSNGGSLTTKARICARISVEIGFSTKSVGHCPVSTSFNVLRYLTDKATLLKLALLGLCISLCHVSSLSRHMFRSEAMHPTYAALGPNKYHKSRVLTSPWKNIKRFVHLHGSDIKHVGGSNRRFPVLYSEKILWKARM
jgi:hypothetical protein